MDKQQLLKLAESKGLRMIQEYEDGFACVGKDKEGRPVLISSTLKAGKPSAHFLGTVDGKTAAQWLQEVA